MGAEEYFKRGIRRYQDGDYDSATSDYIKAVESEPTLVPAWCNRELVLRKSRIQQDYYDLNRDEAGIR